MKKVIKLGLVTAIAALVAGCGNLSKVSDAGTTENPVFPKIQDSVMNHDGTQKGSWENWDSLKQIETGMNKSQIYRLIGEPHFKEGLFGVREWDYVLNYRENGELKTCQYKILFDKDMNVAQQWWLPNGCNGYARFDLNADALFAFDRADLSEQGRATLAEFAQKAIAYNVTSLVIEGHTDRLGSDAYNIDLSKRRAETVKNELQALGVTIPMQTAGLGETQPVKECASDNASAQEKACLQPNRRVTILTQGGSVARTNSTEAGFDGPVPVKIHKDNARKTTWEK